jgi:hypothetical protein
MLLEALNWTLRILEKVGLMKQRLRPEALLTAARRQTGLDDFGDETFREPLSRLLDSCVREARLNPVGRIILTRDVLQLLINRLEIQRDREEHLGIKEEAIVAPLVITGLPRTGTTLLHGLLAQNHDAYYAPATWEVMFPSPPPSTGEGRRIKRAARSLSWFNRLVPEFRKIHPISAHPPQECIAIMSRTFMSDQFDTMFRVPAYQSWLERQDMRPAYIYHRQFLQHLQYGRPARRFLLKAPAHMSSIEGLFTVYPDAHAMQMHREPLEVLPSVASLTTVLRSAFGDFVDPSAIGREVTRFWGDALEKCLAARTRLCAGAFIDVDFADLVRHPIEVVRRLYLELGDSLSSQVEDSMRAFLAVYPQPKYGEAFGMNSVKVHQRFGVYSERFGLS